MYEEDKLRPSTASEGTTVCRLTRSNPQKNTHGQVFLLCKRC